MKKKILLLSLSICFLYIFNVNDLLAYDLGKTPTDSDYTNSKATIVCSYMIEDNIYDPYVWILYKDYNKSYEIVYDKIIASKEDYNKPNFREELSSNSRPNEASEFILKPFDKTIMGIECATEEVSKQKSFLSQDTYEDLIKNGICPDKAYVSSGEYYGIFGIPSDYNNASVCFENDGENYCQDISNKDFGSKYCNYNGFNIYLDYESIKKVDLSNAFLDITDDDIEIFFNGIDLGNADFDKGNEDLNLLCSKIAKSDSKELMKTIAQDTLLFNLKKYITNKDISFLEPWDSYKRFKNLWEYKYNKIIREFLNYCDERNYEIDDEKKETISDADIVYDAGLNILGDKDITISETVGTCQSYLGLVSQEGEPAYYINIVYNVVKYLSIAFVIVLTILDAIKVLTSSDADKNLSEVFRKGIIRLIILIGIFLIPTLIEAIANLFGASNVLCGIG